MKALQEVGAGKVLRFFFSSLFLVLFRFLLFPPLRSLALRLVGSDIGPDAVIHDVTFFNAYRAGFRALQVGKSCFIGEQCLLDLADEIILQEHVTFAERVTVLTHTNVGYDDHPLQTYFPAMTAPVRCERGSFVGVNATLLPGITLGECAFVAAGSVVTKDVPAWALVAGVPARVIGDVRQREKRAP